ncbi:argininosuccinate lyase [Formosa agariphila KMM 3901]|uniref:Argininosuccinate lyase n=1 Tax=Formosa agariphila (strain DSM 15362 / KCTC 12365 / LMG 23005 / KMM 3901 / M-2Alg 35-1) TaxID=1347342 RepID=T2KGZ0_FORAG|nr:argininosuccinate lyase [Formosa agariphila]CDF78055.1 argininosuccinate lyase [Formosa agariphila KMM 3901]
MKLWDKGLSIDKKIEQFTVGNDREIDIHIAKYDVIASKAHAKMLQSINIITAEELEQLLGGLDVLEAQIEDGTFVIEESFEDVHSKIEFELTKTLGDVGKKIHTARSRNDQVLVALQLYFKEELKTIQDKTKTFFDTLIGLAETHKDALLPGYTHLQVAMPSSFGVWFSAYAELLIDDVYMLQAAQKVADQNPLGSAAGYGSSFPIDRELTTKEMGFSTLKYNVVAAQMSRGKSERTIAASLGSLANTLSRFAMDICLYNSQNFGFIAFPDELTTGSSIMPHKKNPDVFELIRGKSNKIQALQTEMVLITNNLPSGYHRDYQLLKENMIQALEDMKDILDIFNFSIAQVKVKDIDLHDEKYKFLFTVDNINTLVVEGMSFRDAYKKIGGEVEAGTYVPYDSKKHTHLGSIHNLGLDKISLKFPKL